MKTLLVPVDFSDVTARVVEYAGTMAKTFDASLVLLHIADPEPEFIGYEPGPQTVRDAVAETISEEHRRLHQLDEQLEADGLKVTALVIQGYPVEKILAEAEKHDADMIIMGSHGHGALRNLLVGSVTEGVMRKAACPVLVIPAG